LISGDKAVISVEGKVVLISGSGKADGQGAAEARALAENGALVYIADIIDEEGHATAEALGDAVEFVHLDVTSEAGWSQAVETIVSKHGRLDGLVNNAGVWSMSGIQDTSLEEYRRVIEVNQVGPFLGIKAVAGIMSAAGSGSIINIGSAASLRVGVQYWHNKLTAHSYTVTKWAVHGMTKAVAMELAPHNVRVNSIHPGPIHTSMLGGDLDDIAACIPMQRLGRPEEIAEMVVFLVSDSCTFMSGAEIAIDGGATV
jgi:3alpha(or 20beta)-hydroxysteroid dehydrogenase